MYFNKHINNFEEFKQLIAHEPYYGTPILPFSQEKDFEELAEFFKGKSVAIVGPASDLIDQNKGKEIDGYDIVCKVGWMYNIIDNLNYGSRCDVLFNGCFSQDIDPKEKFINKNIKRVITPIKSCMPGILDVHKRDLWSYYNYLKNELQEISFNTIGMLSCAFDNITKTRATLGTFAINFLLKQDLKEFGIYGFTWYKNSGYNPQYGQQNVGSHGYSHNIEITYLKQLIINSKFKIYLNKEVAKVLNL